MPTINRQTSKKYWATLPTQEIAGELIERIRQYYLFLRQTGRMALYQRAYQMYYGPGINGGQVSFSGEQGELVILSVNQYRSLLKNLHTLITANRPSYTCRAANTDHKSQAQCILGQALVDYYLREKDLEYYLDTAAELAIAAFGEAFVSVPWDATIGEPYGTNEMGGAVRQGDIKYRAFGPLEWVRDFAKDTAMDHHWGIEVSWVNKYEYASTYHEYYDEIVSLTPDSSLFDDIDGFGAWRATIFGSFDVDDIPCFTFYYEPTDAMPQGRQVVFLSDTLVLFDGPLPYKEVPVYRISAGEYLGTPFAYTIGFDLMPVQQIYDSLHSAICTNHNASAVNNFWTKKGDTPDIDLLAGGLRSIQSDEKPEVLNLLQTAPEVYAYEQRLGVIMETLSGVNQVARGNPERDMSGSAMALLQATAIQFSNYLQKSYIKLLEACGTATLDRLKVFAKVPRVAAIAGKYNRQYLEEFVGDDLALINRVLVDVGNPIMNTTAGKMDLADKFLKTGLIHTPEQYLMVYTTGRVEPLYEELQSDLMLIRQENEMISEGVSPQVLITDNPLLHMKEHKVVGNSPEARNNPAIMQAYTQHMQEHINIWKGHLDPMTGQWIPGIDPDLANMLGVPLPPSIQPPMLGPVNPKDVPANDRGNAKGLPAPSMEKSKASAEAGVKDPNMPKLPPGTPAQTQSAAMQ